MSTPFHRRGTDSAIVGSVIAELDDSRQRLPDLNARAEATRKGIDGFLARVRPQLEAAGLVLKPELDAGISRRPARTLLGLLGFFTSAGERHFQGLGQRPGAFVCSVHKLDETLSRLGVMGDHLPRDSLYTHFLSPEGPHSFTGQPAEAWNAHVVRETHAKLTRACDLVRFIRDGVLSLEEAEGPRALHEAGEHVEALLPLYRGYHVAPDGQQEPRMGEFFFLNWREYLLSYPVGGRMWPAPNPAHIPCWPRLDATIGHFDRDFIGIVEERTGAMLPEEREPLLAEFRMPSLGNVFLRRLGLNVQIVEVTNRHALAHAVLVSASPVMVEAIKAFVRLIEAAKRLTSAHLALIKNYITRPSLKLVEAPKTSMTRPSDAGVSGRKLEDTVRLVSMRREHPVTELFVEAARLMTHR